MGSHAAHRTRRLPAHRGDSHEHQRSSARTDIPCVNLAEAALAAPFAGFGNYETFPAIYEKAAVYCSRIATYHPLPDGNKRTAYDVMREFLDRNDVAFKHPDGGLEATAQAIEELAANTMDEPAFIAWVRGRTRD